MVKYVRNFVNVTTFMNNLFNTVCICKCRWCYKIKILIAFEALESSFKYSKNKKI